MPSGCPGEVVVVAGTAVADVPLGLLVAFSARDCAQETGNPRHTATSTHRVTEGQLYRRPLVNRIEDIVVKLLMGQVQLALSILLIAPVNE